MRNSFVRQFVTVEMFVCRILKNFLWIFFVVFPSNSLICPIFNVFNNETTLIDFCPENSSLCSFWTNENSSNRRCLGIYAFDENFSSKIPRIRIRQLAIVDDFEKRYVNRTQCILDVDRTGQNLLCRCNSDNCTLKWRRAEKFVQQNLFHRSFVEKRDDRQWIFVLPIVVVVVLITIIVFVTISMKTSRKQKENRSFSTNLSNSEIEDFLSSKTIFESMISQSKTNKIFRFSLDDDEKKEIVVKMFNNEISSRNLYENEIEILRLVEHSSIIQLIGTGWHVQCPYLIFDYYPLGSLDHYLTEKKSSLSTCFSFLRSFLQAIDYLHYEDLSANDYFSSHRIRKAIIVHRDIKSSNILVKNSTPLTLVLTDFGLAKILPTILTANDFIQIGTYRYMAPELLELAISHTSQALCHVDIYAAALVMWEIVGQCDEYPHPIEHQLPYVEYVKPEEENNENRILDTLHRIVVNERKRPILHRTTEMNSKLGEIFNLIEDCWKHEPESRLNARPALSRLERLFNSTN